MSLNIAMRRDLNADVTTMTLTGELNLHTVTSVRRCLRTCLAECPAAVVVDIRRLDVTNPVALTVFPATAADQNLGPESPVLLCTGPDFTGRLAQAAIGAIPHYASPDEARAAAASTRALTLRSELTIRHSEDAPRVARREVRRACIEWGLEQVSKAAELIASELVTNVILHAGTDARLELSNRGDFLHIRVHDSSAVKPALLDTGLDQQAEHGRGLYLVDLYSTTWGHVANGQGKVVWATLRARPIKSATD